MSLYRESIRRLSRLGLTLLAVFTVICTVAAVQNCAMGKDQMLSPPLSMMQFMLGYIYIGGVGLAYTGYSFLLKRPDSDFYHSLPVKRSDLFLSVTMAGLTWIVATVFVVSFSTTLVHIITGRAFVPLYPLMNFGFYISASMLVFAAAAMAMSVTGTWFSTVVVTGLVLFLPRFILFVIARCIAANTAGLINWSDFGLLLNPVYNTAVAPLILPFRPALNGQVMNFSTSAYSIALAALELAAAGTLFVKRKSELAEHGAGGRTLQTAFACAAALPLLLIIVSGRLFGRGVTGVQTFNTSVAIVLALSLACYVIFQMAMLHNWKRTIKSLPFYLCAAAAALGVSLLATVCSNRVLSFRPVSGDIASVSFLPTESGIGGVVSYRSMLVEDIVFDDAETLSYVSDSLEETLDLAINSAYGLEEYYHRYNYYGNVNPTEEQQLVMAPVRFRLKNGKETVRNVLFPSRASLEAVRLKNDDYVEALSTFAPQETIRYWNAPEGTYIGDTERLRQSYVAEFPLWSIDSDKGDFDINVYPSHLSLTDETGLNQPIGTVGIGGYVGTVRYRDSYPITARLPETASLYMRICNERSDADYGRMLDTLEACLAQDASEWNYFNLNMTAFNAPGEGNLDGKPASMYLSVWGKEHDPSDEMFDVIMELAQLLEKGTESDDPGAVTMAAQYWSQRNDVREDTVVIPKYLAFSEADTTNIIRLVNQWRLNYYADLIGEAEDMPAAKPVAEAAPKA